MSNETKPKFMNDLAMKLIACLFILICIAVGIVGLILPIIPGLVFLAIAAMVAAKCFPSIDRRLRENDTMRRYLDSGEGFTGLSIWGKIQYCLWLFIKVFVDSLLFIIRLVGKVLGFVVKKQHYNQ